MLDDDGFTLIKSSQLALNPKRRSPPGVASQVVWLKASNSTTLFPIRFAILAITPPNDCFSDSNTLQCIYWRSCHRDRYRTE